MIASRSFSVRNAGSRRVSLRIRASGSWIEVEPAELTLAPGATARVETRLLERRPGGELRVLVDGTPRAVIALSVEAGAASAGRAPAGQAGSVERLADPERLALLMAGRRRPAAPSDWKPKLFGRMFGGDAPWGGAQDAWELLKAGAVEEGRELLRRMAKHRPGDFEGQVLGAFELLRPPEDRDESAARLKNLTGYAPSSAELHGLYAIGTFSSNPKFAWESYQRCREAGGRGPLGAFVANLAELCVCDITLQILFSPVGKEITSIIVNPALKGAAQLLLRDHAGAQASFASAWRDPERHADNYVEKLGLALPEAARAAMAALMRRYALTGFAVLFADLGLEEPGLEAARLCEREEAALRPVIEKGLKERGGR